MRNEIPTNWFMMENVFIVFVVVVVGGGGIIIILTPYHYRPKHIFTLIHKMILSLSCLFPLCGYNSLNRTINEWIFLFYFLLLQMGCEMTIFFLSVFLSNRDHFRAVGFITRNFLALFEIFFFA